MQYVADESSWILISWSNVSVWNAYQWKPICGAVYILKSGSVDVRIFVFVLPISVSLVCCIIELNMLCCLFLLLSIYDKLLIVLSVWIIRGIGSWLKRADSLALADS